MSIDNSHHANVESKDELLRQILLSELNKRGISQAKFAKLLGISKPYLNEILHGVKSGKRKALQFLIALNMTPTISTMNGDPLIFSCHLVDKTHKEYFEILKEILESGDERVPSAIKENLLAFQTSIEKSKRIDKLEEKLNEIISEMNTRKQPNCSDLIDKTKSSQSHKKNGNVIFLTARSAAVNAKYKGDSGKVINIRNYTHSQPGSKKRIR